MNALYEVLPTTWHGYHINTGFHIGVQISLLFEDESLNERARVEILLGLLFSDENGEIKELPSEDEIAECLNWFMTGWNYDKSPSGEKSNERIIDYNVDQGRIIADFIQIYGIDLTTTEMHWFKFNWLLWNMPRDRSSFMQVIEIRQKKPDKKASHEEKKAIAKAKEIYSLKPTERTYSHEEVKAIDEFDAFMEKIKNKSKGDE